MRKGRSVEDMTEEEYAYVRYTAREENPHARCTCMNQKNEDGICSYCEWEEQKVEDDENTQEETD